MNFWLIYFGIALFILVLKFVHARLAIDKLQNFLVDYRYLIEKYVYNKDKAYFRLFVLHFMQLNYGEDYETKMIEKLKGEVISYGCSNQIYVIVLFTLLWPGAILFTSIYLVFKNRHNLFNFLLKTFLTRDEMDNDRRDEMNNDSSSTLSTALQIICGIILAIILILILST